MHRRAQLSMVLIVGIILLIVISLLLYLSITAINNAVQGEGSKSSTLATELQPIQESLASCLEQSLEEGLSLLGKQGGNLYQFQGGPLPDPDELFEGTLYAQVNNQPVAYLIHPPRFDTGVSFKEPPKYPYETFPYLNADINDPPSDKVSVGMNTLPPLRKTDGPNSFASQLEKYAEVHTKECDLSTFEEQGWVVDLEELNTQTLLTDDAVTIFLQEPVPVTSEITSEQATITARATKPVRLIQIYNQVKLLINQDNKDISFQLKTHKPTQPGFALNMIEDVRPGDDLFILKDANSVVLGRSFEFYFMRHNRNPAVHYIEPNSFSFNRSTVIQPQMLLPPYLTEYTALDPDEDDVSFTFRVSNRGDQPLLPQTLNTPLMRVRVIASDGLLDDYQDLDVHALN